MVDEAECRDVDPQGGTLMAWVGAAQRQPEAPQATESPAGSYSLTLRDVEARLGRAIEQAQGNAGRTQAGAMPPGQQQLMDATQAAWQAMQSGAPESMRGAATGPYADADHAFRQAVEKMRVGQTPPDQAVDAAREAHAALGKLREAAARQGGGAATGASSSPSPAASGQGPLQEPPRR